MVGVFKPQSTNSPPEQLCLVGVPTPNLELRTPNSSSTQQTSLGQLLAAVKDSLIHATQAEIAAALTGDYRSELVFILTQELQLYDMFQAQIAACDLQIEQCLDHFADQVDVVQSPLPAAKRRGKKQPGNAPSFDLRTHLYRISGVDFTVWAC